MDRPVSFAVVAVLALGAGALVGRSLLDSMNDPDEDTLRALARSVDPTPAPEKPRGLPLVIALLDGLGEPMFSRALDRAGLTNWQWRATVHMGAPSLSRPAYHALLTGVPQQIAGIRNNAHVGSGRADSLPTRVRAARGDVAWVLEGVSWFHDLFGEPTDEASIGWGYVVPAESLSPSRLHEGARLLGAAPTLSIVHYAAIDWAGHEQGASSAAYEQAGFAAMESIARLREIVAKDAVWMIGADHGHRAVGGHGGPEPDVCLVTWVGFWPSDETPRIEVRDVARVEQLAPTFAAILGVSPPREALGAPLPLPSGPVAASEAFEARVRNVAEAQQASSTRARSRMNLRGAAVAVVVAFAAWLASRRGQLGRFADGVWLALGACVAFWLLGPGMTLSAITTKARYLLHTSLTLTLGASVALLALRRPVSPSRVLAVAGAIPIAVWMVVGGSLGRAVVSDIGYLLLPTTGLLPWAIAGALAMGRAQTALRAWRRKRPIAAQDSRPIRGPASTRAPTDDPGAPDT